ncbi:MAG: hypothetical protein IKK09_00850 [Clostridia bacterium]|nr:hypothetical protein [Clostridia bacterium]
MKTTTTKMVTGLGLGLVAGGAAAALGAAMMSPSLKKQTRKNAMKAMKTVGTMMDSVNSMMK